MEIIHAWLIFFEWSVINMQAPIEEFINWLVEEGKAAKTVESYSSDIRKFEVYRKDKAINGEQLLTRFLFVRYNQYLQEQGFAISTINRKSTA